jgi:DNA polymerase-4
MWKDVIAHADMDAFYASVEQLDDPDLRGKSVIVGGAGNRGVVTSASYEARQFGVRAAMPSAQARRLCPEAIFVRIRMDRYIEISKQIRAIFESFTPIVEPLSLDEAFLDLTGTERIGGTPIEAAREIKRRVREATGLIVSVGVAPVKLVAKILSDLSKPDGLLVLGPEHLREFLGPLPVERLWGVGRVTLERLHSAGIQTIADLAHRDAAMLRSRFGSMGTHLRELALAHDSRRVIADWQRKSYGEESTFEHDLQIDSLDLKRVLIAHGEELARRLRSDQVKARTVILKVKLARPLGGGRYPMLTRSFSLDFPTNDGGEISRRAMQLLERIREKENIRLAGVQVHNLERPDTSQLGLFDKPTAETRSTRLNRAMDAIAKRFGGDAVSRGQVRASKAAPTTRIK